MKKFISGLVCSVFTLTTIASAQINKPTINGETGVYEVSGTSSVKNGYVSLIVTAPGKDISNITPESIADFAVNVYELETDENGGWSGRFTLPSAAPGGRYSVYSGAEDSTYFYYATPAEINEALEALSDASSENISGILEEYTIEKEILGLNLDGDYKTYTAEEQNLTLFSEAMTNFLKPISPLALGDVQEAFEKSLEVLRFISGDDCTVATSLENGILDITFDNAYTNEIAQMYCGLRTTSSDIQHIAKEIRIAEGLVAINRTTKGKMTEVLEKYNDVLGLELDGDYASLDKVEVNKGLVSQNFNDLNSLKSAFESSVEYVSRKSSDSKHTSVGGGGGKVTSSVSYVPQPDLPSGNDDVKFTDISDAEWASEYIVSLARKGIVNGIGDGKFNPLGAVTREAFVKMLVSAFGLTLNNGGAAFDDVKAGEWYAPYISSAVSAGIINGVSDSHFGIGTPVTREQMAVMAARMLKHTGVQLSSKEISFIDSDQISEYAKSAVAEGYSVGIISGMPDGSFAPNQYMNRAEAAKIIFEMMKVGGIDV